MKIEQAKEIHAITDQIKRLEDCNDRIESFLSECINMSADITMRISGANIAQLVIDDEDNIKQCLNNQLFKNNRRLESLEIQLEKY